MGRSRATRHCQACPFYLQIGSGRRRHVCTTCSTPFGTIPMTPMRYDDARTSPRWCPLGHVVYGVPFPIFKPGKDPVYIDPVTIRDRMAALLDGR